MRIQMQVEPYSESYEFDYKKIFLLVIVIVAIGGGIYFMFGTEMSLPEGTEGTIEGTVNVGEGAARDYTTANIFYYSSDADKYQELLDSDVKAIDTKNTHYTLNYDYFDEEGKTKLLEITGLEAITDPTLFVIDPGEGEVKVVKKFENYDDFTNFRRELKRALEDYEG